LYCITVQRDIWRSLNKVKLMSNGVAGNRPEDYTVMLLQSVYDYFAKVALEWDEEKVFGAALE